ncbi:N-acetylmuramoyl-L-alanine amidase [Jeotgalibacillus sp. ET6]|uniref:cell wall-binding repeat-containing protein n=1 Tax=Jeotgalibacillus sp. ET6 TaxID=3037260 RepID=UPI0024182650|nr:cell wall-binding repeat-containing protein [Jeotgalibacillus sp. ET6]MDG5471569.1 N-acetylmuramoyl-L-alanine amidase [Jeotgalibacillus sp. ET6]
MHKIKVFFLSLILFFSFSLVSEAESNKNLVVIDPGHGGIYSGTLGYSGASTGYHEKHANLEVSLKLRDELKKRGYEVLMTRETDKHFASPNSADLRARMNVANNYAKGRNDNAVFISVHHNATGTPSYRGYETYYFDINQGIDPNYPPDPMQIKYSPESKKVAASIHNGVLSSAPLPEGRGMVPMDFYVTRNAQMPSVLVEVGYMSNPTEERQIKDPAIQSKVSTGIANGLDEYFDNYDYYEVYDQNDKLLYKHASKENALNWASSRKNVKVIYNKTNEEIFSNIFYGYAVFHSSQVSFKHYFVSESKAVEFAKKWRNTRVVDNVKREIVWSNYITPNYHIVHAQQGVLEEKFDAQSASERAQRWRNTSVLDVKSNTIIWSNYLTKKYEVHHTSKGLLKAFYSEKDAKEYSKIWKNTTVKNKSNGSILFSNLDSSYSHRFVANEVSAKDRMLTAIEVSKELYPNGFSSNKKQKTVVLATAFEFADALSAGPYAAQLDNAPILLTRSQSMSDQLKNELKRLKPNKVVIVGGTYPVSENVSKELKSMGYAVERVSGSDRIETNLNINAKLTNVKNAIVVSSQNFPDALGATPVAVNTNSSIVLVNTENSLTPSAVDYLQKKTVSIVGGTGVVTAKTEDTLVQELGGDRVIRLSGKNRYDTLTAVLDHYHSDMHSNTVLVSTGSNFPDALTASSLSKKYSAPLVLVNDHLPASLDEFVTSYGNENVVERVISVGGVVKTQPLNRIIQLTK